jgi:hypothetical protein
MLHFCLKLHFAIMCTCLSLFGLTTLLLNLSVFFQIFEVPMLHVFLKQHFANIYIMSLICLCLALLLLYSCDHIIFSRFFQIFYTLF